MYAQARPQGRIAGTARASAHRKSSSGARAAPLASTAALGGAFRHHAAAPSVRRLIGALSSHRQPHAGRVMAMAAAGGGSASSADVVVSVSELKTTTWRAIKTYGYTDEEADIMLDVMMYAQLRGNNQGIIKVTTGGIAKDKNCKPVEVEHETRLSALLNGNNSAGMLALSKGVDLALEKAKANGFGIVGTHRTFTSTGALGYYAKRVADEGLIAVCLAQSPEFVAPHGALEAIFGTNPIGVAIPTPDGPMVMDMATSAYSYFGLLEAKTAGKKLPGQVALDAQGHLTDDAEAALDGGAIRVFDGSYKGSNLALVVELLAGPLVGAAIADKMEEKNWGNLIAAIDPKLLGAGEFEQRVQTVLDRVKGARKLPGVDEIFLPGERGDKIAADRIAADQIPLEPNLWKNLVDMAATLEESVVPRPAHKEGLSIDTMLCHPELYTTVVDPYDATNPPLYQTATFAQPSSTTNGEYDYTRSGNPTRTLLEQQMAAYEGGTRSFAFASGMAALMAVTRLVKTGEKIVTGEDIYGGTSRLLAQVVPKQGVNVVNVDTLDLKAVKVALTPDTTLVMLESPTNPRLQITDIRAIADMAHAVGALVIVDNSVMAPVFQRPLELGADIVMTSTTKFVSGQSDTTGGLLTVKDEQLGKDIYFHQNAEGIHLPPFDCWLCLRGMKTMSLRMHKQQENAMKLAEYLVAHPLVTSVNYPGLPGSPGYELHKSQAKGAGSILSFATGNIEASKTIVEETELFKITVSFGNVTSLISLPCFMSHASIPAEVRAARGLPDDLIRISTGIEDIDDLLADLDRAMTLGAAAAGVPLGAGAGAGGAAGGAGDIAGRESELLARIAALEQKLGEKSVS